MFKFASSANAECASNTKKQTKKNSKQKREQKKEETLAAGCK